MSEPVKILSEALLTEKATMLSSKFNQYVFSVSPSANRIHIKHAVEDFFGVTVL